MLNEKKAGEGGGRREEGRREIRRDLCYEGGEEIYHDLFSGDVFTHTTHVCYTCGLLFCY